ncbi:MAG TPA: XrtA system polysaccharide deacetylase [Gemmatimonadaceae bacterium]|nr:XrtA system polysaccharide deacetylase [Gemmatimonadaceae bacterium]
MSAAQYSATEHMFTVDVEEHFQVSAFDDLVPRSQWASYPSRVASTVDLLLDLLAQHNAKGTFFTLGWIADRHQDVVRRIAAAGHEIASHGWWHRRVTAMTPEEFRDDIRASKALLEDVSGQPVVGFRAPSFSIVPGLEWAFDVLIEEGYRYDSSLFPIRRPGYGYPSAPPIPHVIRRASGSLCELPLTTTVVGKLRIPAAGGAYLRHFPYGVIRRAFREHDESGIPGMFYIHPWELDPDQPRLPVGWPTRMRHYAGLQRTQARVQRLLGALRFTSVSRCLRLQAPPATTTQTA